MQKYIGTITFKEFEERYEQYGGIPTRSRVKFDDKVTIWEVEEYVYSRHLRRRIKQKFIRFTIERTGESFDWDDRAKEFQTAVTNSSPAKKKKKRKGKVPRGVSLLEGKQKVFKVRITRIVK